ncbi:hypothetical protein ACUSIJ_07070 [Pseudochelatococcus sp. B33]
MQQSSGVLYAAPVVRSSGGSGVFEGLRFVSRWLVILLAAALAGLLAASFVPDRYTASTVLALAEGRGLAPVGDSPSAAAAVIASPDLAREVVARLGPGPAAEIGTPRLPPGIARWLGSVGLVSARPLESAEMRAADAYRRALDLEPRDGAGVLTVGVAAGSADVAARTANIAAQVYLERRAAALTERDQALAAAAEGVARAQQELRQAIDKAAAFRGDPAASDTARRAQAAAADLSLLVAERAALLAERDAIARRLMSVETLRGSGDLFDAPFEGVHLLRHLVEQRLTLRAELAAERRIREARDWRVRALTARADDLDSQIAAATGSAHGWLISERDHLSQRIAGVDGAIHLRQAIIAAAADNERRQGDLDHAIGAARDRLALERERLRDESERVRDRAAAARVLTVADAPARPDADRPTIAGIAAALLTGLAAWRLLGRGRSGRDSVPDGAARQPHAGPRPDPHPDSPTPASPGASAAGAAPPPLPAAPGSPLVSVRVGEAGDRALEALLARLAVAPRTGGGRHLTVVGAEDDGASVSVARALAQHLARRERVVLLDLATSGGEAPGFADLIAGRASFSEIITREPGARLHNVARGRASLDAAQIGDTTLLALAALDQTYDWIVEIVPAPGNGELAGKLLARAQGVVLVANGNALDVGAFAVYEGLREKGISNIVVGLSGR